MQHQVIVTSEGMKTEEGQARIKATMDAKDEAIWAAIQNFKELMKSINYNPGKQQLISIITEWYGDDIAATELVEDCFKTLKAIDEANEEFLKAAAGRD